MSQAGIASTTAGPSPPAVPTQFTTDAGVAVPVANNLNVFGSGSITSTGIGATVTYQLTGLTNHAVLVGAGTTTITNVGPSSATGQVLQNNVAADPSYSTATYPSVASSAGTILRADGTNWLATTATYPNTTTINQLLYSSAANTISGLATANNATLSTGATGIPVLTAIGARQFLAANASGVLASRALSVVIQVFSTAGAATYTPTTGMLYCIIEALGGGGAGGGAAATTAAQVSVGGGGGAGEYALGVFSAATIGVSQAVTIGAAGTGNSGAAGGNGGNTNVGALISANGGIGGPTPAAATPLSTIGGLGGTGGAGGSFRTPGSPGKSAWGSVAVPVTMGGEGASSQYGAGGIATTFDVAGVAGLGKGSGGSGAQNFISVGALAGGNGTTGLVIITEYVIN